MPQFAPLSTVFLADDPTTSLRGLGPALTRPADDPDPGAEPAIAAP